VAHRQVTGPPARVPVPRGAPLQGRGLGKREGPSLGATGRGDRRTAPVDPPTGEAPRPGVPPCTGPAEPPGVHCRHGGVMSDPIAPAARGPPSPRPALQRARNPTVDLSTYITVSCLASLRPASRRPPSLPRPPKLPLTFQGDPPRAWLKPLFSPPGDARRAAKGSICHARSVASLHCAEPPERRLPCLRLVARRNPAE